LTDGPFFVSNVFDIRGLPCFTLKVSLQNRLVFQLAYDSNGSNDSNDYDDSNDSYDSDDSNDSMDSRDYSILNYNPRGLINSLICFS
jgi:hypothetical protein